MTITCGANRLLQICFWTNVVRIRVAEWVIIVIIEECVGPSVEF